jgi:hypothetical protein
MRRRERPRILRDGGSRYNLDRAKCEHVTLTRRQAFGHRGQ